MSGKIDWSITGKKKRANYSAEKAEEMREKNRVRMANRRAEKKKQVAYPLINYFK